MVCPKCGAKIKKTDLSPVCKHCGAHIMYYNQEEDLARDAKKTELEFAKARLLGAKVKTAYIKGRYAILRLIMCFACAGAMFIPLCNVNINFPWWNYKISIDAIGLYNIIKDSFWTLFGAASDIGILSPLVINIFASIIIYIITLFLTVISSCVWLFSFFNIKKSTRVMMHIGLVEQCLCALNTVLSIIITHSANSYSFISGTFTGGSLICLICFGLFTFANYMLNKKGQKVELKDADKKRIEIYEQVKNGEIEIDSLPLPVVKDDNKEKNGNE